MFGDPDTTREFSAAATLQAILDVEVALAEVQVALDIIPSSCLGPITQAAKVTLYEPAAIASGATGAGNLAIPLIRALTERVAAISPVAARYVHWGATSQDVIDTGLVLQLRRSAAPLVEHLGRSARAAATQAQRHIDTVMPGRTWLQQAVPITYGLKAASWLDALLRRRDAVEQALETVSVLQFGGAAGTLAALGAEGPAVAERLAEQLGLANPDVPWHAHRDRIVQYACSLGVACGTLGKIARDVSLLAQTEVGEVTPAVSGGSSAMPHKQNPVHASVAVAAAVRAPGLVATMLAAMPQEHERGLGGWQVEWTTVPDLVRLSAGSARSVADMLTDLRVDEERMRANLDLTRGLILSEAVAMALAPHVGREGAHRLVQSAIGRFSDGGSTLAEALALDQEVSKHLSAADLARLISPEGYLGAARELVGRVLARAAKTP